ncbi:MAG: hypothetical protein DRP50_01490 [Thermotoga sp.]|nr:hypothetical protein [Thermotogota bacterium]RKX55955.1 MAG: hypothetical protein DRP50_01490 [Thermotoga sp.]
MNDEELMKILKMVEGHEISAKEGLGLIRSLETPEKETENIKKVLKIKVFDKGKSQQVVNIRIPIKLAGEAFKFIPKDTLDEMDKAGVNTRELLKLLGSSDIPNLVNFDTDEIRVEVGVETT